MSSRSLLTRVLPKAFLSGAGAGSARLLQLRSPGGQVIHPVGISTRYKSFQSEKMNIKRHLNSQASDSNKGSNARHGSSKFQWESRMLFDRFVAEIEKGRQQPGVDKIQDATLSKLREWASGDYFPPDLLKPVKQWSAQLEKLFSDLATDQVTLLLDAFENTHREAWRLTYRKSQVQRRPVPRSKKHLKRTLNLKLLRDLKKVRLREQAARAAKNAARLEIEDINDTASSVMVTLRISNGIESKLLIERTSQFAEPSKVCMVFCHNPSKGEISHQLFETRGKREGGSLTAYVRQVMPRVDPALGLGSSRVSDVYSAVLNCIRLMFPDLEITSTRQSIYSAKGPSTPGSTGQPSGDTGRGKRGFRQALSTASRSKENYSRKRGDDLASDSEDFSGAGDNDLASKIDRNALFMFREFVRAKMNEELVYPHDSKNKD
ncbi:hypothetical protein L486_03617 [Kwoniella mangroviensis CBS 10435]|uniref:Uncharacterized protein n=1 Tax=Kwoniella mangroviensis CBS 10435 TaxID=1331196 RepID=A0A1B9IUA5_9TREE|nr:hypothetical protein L486_03617 [Kwoniella mangroviensis CBS 10435]OCF76627.1 hypothetical protein I204_02325 [Kwoniella mangroviensis CBS 8886]